MSRTSSNDRRVSDPASHEQLSEYRDGLAQRLAEVDARIAAAAAEAGRDTDEITRLIVTKFHPVELIEALLDLGVRDFAENRHQEAAEKATALRTHPLDGHFRWHFVGQLQSNKAKAVRRYASSVHSVDRRSLLSALSSEHEEIGAFVQVDLSRDPGRGGIPPEELLPFADAVAESEGIRLDGIMAVAPLGAEPRSAFAALRELSERLRVAHPDARSISAGMSNDFADAIAEGATHLRIGTAITGNRPEAR